jgi:hypothetical protein
MANFKYDGHQQLRGVWGGSPDSVPAQYCHQAVNRFFREDYNKARPSIRSIELEFESEEERIWFQGANGQGATFYNSYPSFITSRLVCSIGGRIYTIEINGRTGVVRKLYDGNSRQFMHAWFAQGFQWLVIQDGIHPPLFWDGTNAPRRSDLAKNEMPIGSVMAFLHGRFVVASADGKNSIFVGDIAYGATLTVPDDILSFTDKTYWADGGNFNTPSNLGNVMGLYPMPFLDTGTGQNECVIGCTAGFASLDISTPRPQWIDNQVLRVSLIGDGLASSHALAALNGDLFFRSQNGVNSYRNARIEYSQHWNQTPVSREVNYWLKPDRKDYLEFVPMVSWQNMVMCGTSPLIANPNNEAFGKHRYCRGMVVMDADAMSTAGRDGAPVWHGMWSGVRPWAFAQGYIGNANRCFAFSYDRDGRNRLYEFTLSDGDDWFGDERRKIMGRYDTSMFGNVETVTSAFAPKIINGGVIELSQIQGASEFTVEYRPDGSPCWVFVDHGAPGCDCPTRATCEQEPLRPLTAAPQWTRKYFEAVEPTECVPGSDQPANNFHHCQVRVNCTGSFVVDRLNIRFELKPDGQIAKCLFNTCEPIDCCPAEADYTYHIAPVGVNDEVPEVPIPPPRPFVATRSVRLCCPDVPSLCVVGIGQGQSTVSQAQADAQAQANANAAAQTLLSQNCPTCTPSTENDQFVSSGDVVDYSGFFMSGLYAGLEGLPFRLVNVLTDIMIIYGHVDASGTFSTDQVYTSDYDVATNILTDTQPGSARLQLQRGCHPLGVDTWPSVEPYYGS